MDDDNDDDDDNHDVDAHWFPLRVRAEANCMRHHSSECHILPHNCTIQWSIHRTKKKQKNLTVNISWRTKAQYNEGFIEAFLEQQQQQHRQHIKIKSFNK